MVNPLGPSQLWESLTSNFGLAGFEMYGVVGERDNFAANELAGDGAIAETIERKIEGVGSGRNVYAENAGVGHAADVVTIEP